MLELIEKQEQLIRTDDAGRAGVYASQIKVAHTEDGWMLLTAHNIDEEKLIQWISYNSPNMVVEDRFEDVEEAINYIFNNYEEGRVFVLDSLDDMRELKTKLSV